MACPGARTTVSVPLQPPPDEILGWRAAKQLHPEKAVSLPQLRKKLSLTSEEDKGCLDIALAALTRLGLVSNGEAGLIHNRPDNLIEACLRCSSKGFCFALREAGGDDIYIRDHQLNHAGTAIVCWCVSPGRRPPPLP